MLRHHGQKENGQYKYYDIGYNYRLTNIQAAMGVAQMERLDEFIDIKRRNYSVYKSLFSDIEGVERFSEKKWARSNFWFYTIKVNNSHKRPLMEFLLAKNIQVRPIWKLIHTLPMYKDFQHYAISNAVKVYETCINLPCSAGIKQIELEYVADNIMNYFKSL